MKSHELSASEGLVWGMTLAVLPTEGYTITGILEYIPIASFLVTNYMLTFVYGIILIFGILIAYHIGTRHGRREARRQRRAHHYTDQEWQEWQNWQGWQDPGDPSQEQEQEDQTDPNAEPDPINDPGHRPDIKRMIPAEIRHLVHCGYVVLGDNEVNERREECVQSLRPSIEDYTSHRSRSTRSSMARWTHRPCPCVQKNGMELAEHNVMP